MGKPQLKTVDYVKWDFRYPQENDSSGPGNCHVMWWRTGPERADITNTFKQVQQEPDGRTRVNK